MRSRVFRVINRAITLLATNKARFLEDKMDIWDHYQVLTDEENRKVQETLKANNFADCTCPACKSRSFQIIYPNADLMFVLKIPNTNINELRDTSVKHNVFVIVCKECGHMMFFDSVFAKKDRHENV